MDSKKISFKPTCINRESFNNKVANFIHPSGSWDTQKLRELVLSLDCDIIRSIPLNKNLDDKLIWHYDQTVDYTVKSGYKIFMSIKLDGISSSSNIMKKNLEQSVETKNSL